MFFRSRRKDQIRRLDEISERLDKLLHELADHRVHVNVENLHVANASLEKLMFQLDTLDIEELSGALNLGNNFGTDVVRPHKELTQGLPAHVAAAVEDQDTVTSPPPEHLPDGRHVEPTGRGFRVTIPV